jgi:hypothetical protein
MNEECLDMANHPIKPANQRAKSVASHAAGFERAQKAKITLSHNWQFESMAQEKPARKSKI